MQATSSRCHFVCRAIQQQQGALLIDGKAIANQIHLETAREVASLKAQAGRAPGLAVILVGSRKDSHTYVRSKIKACSQAGISSFKIELPENVDEENVLAHIASLNSNPAVDGILVQLPLPKELNAVKIAEAIVPEKDVDGIHPMNIGRLMLKGSQPLFVPCTPRGIIELLQRSGIEIRGKRAAVVGRSNIVGMPVAQLLQNLGATVTVLHTQTPDAAQEARRADILVAAIGKPRYVGREWLKPGAVVVDVGINSEEDASAKRGYRLVGDVHFEDARLVASAISPVPGGVGPMTIAMLLRSTVESALSKWTAEQEKQKNSCQE